MTAEKIGIIGFGNMGRAIAFGARTLFEICVFDKDEQKLTACQGLKTERKVTDLINSSDVIIIAVKPQDMESVLKEIKANFKEQLIISIAAGITTKYLKSKLGEKARIIRVMPNMPAQIGQGISVLYKEDKTTEKDLDLAWQLLNCVGLVLVVDDEKMINAATAVSGSGPAFFCYYLIKERANVSAADAKRDEFIRILTAAAAGIGFDQQEAKVLSEKTVVGTINMMKDMDLSCEEIIKRVASKGGTTEAGIAVLKNGGLLEEAVKAAFFRAEELGQDTPR
jgi:pyrroline-5-carboxylate reductase